MIIFSICYLHYNHIQIRCIESSWYLFTCLNISIHTALHQPHFPTYAEPSPRQNYLCIGPLARYAKSRVAHTAGMPGTFSPPPTSKKTASWGSRHASRHVHHARAVMHDGIATPRWRGKRSRHSQRLRNLQFYVSGKRPMDILEFMSSVHKHSPGIPGDTVQTLKQGMNGSFLHFHSIQATCSLWVSELDVRSFEMARYKAVLILNDL